jgi:hypothetical protein
MASTALALDFILHLAVFRYMDSGFVKIVLLPRRLSSYSFRKSRQETNSRTFRVVCKICGAIAFFFALLVFLLAELSTSVALSLQGNCEVGKERWEDKLYRLWIFRSFLFVLLLVWMACWTWMAVGWLGNL